MEKKKLFNVFELKVTEQIMTIIYGQPLLLNLFFIFLDRKSVHCFHEIKKKNKLIYIFYLKKIHCYGLPIFHLME